MIASALAIPPSQGVPDTRPEPPVRISAKHLGVLALENCCERCFWIQMRCGWKAPFAPFPGIFSTIDSHTKKVVGAYFAKHGRLPEWLPSLGTPIESPSWRKFSWLDPATNILLVGAPDEMTRLADGTLSILDYKCAKKTATADLLAPVYQVQLNGYALIAERLGMGQVSRLALVYGEPMAEADSTLCSERGYAMRFVATIVPVQLQPEIIPPLLARARRICDEPRAPSGRDGCEDCRRLNGLIKATA